MALKLKSKLLVLVSTVILLNDNTANGLKRRIKTRKCRYEFVVNEMDMSNCPNTLPKIQADREPGKSMYDKPVMESVFNLNPPAQLDSGDKPQEVKSWLNTMEEKLVAELHKTNEINSTLSKHELSLSKAEKQLAEYQSNFTTIFRMLRYLEQSIQKQGLQTRNLDKKLSGVMLDVVEVSNVLSNSVPVVNGQQAKGKDIEVQSATQITSCTKSPEVIVFKDCAEVQKHHTTSGIYYVTPAYSPCPIPVWCDMDTTIGGWLLLLRRTNGKTSFNGLWDEYKHGFGNVAGEFYIGNDNMFLLTNQAHYELRIDLWDFEGNRVFALYKSFKIDGERDKYRLHVNTFEGSARDSLHKHNGHKFSTPDRDNDEYNGYNCAKEWEAGWWFTNCWFGFLTGPYYNISSVRYRGISWNEWKHEQLAKAEMKIRPSRLAPHDPELHKNSP